MYFLMQMPLIFVFSDIGQCFYPAAKKQIKIRNLITLEQTKKIYHTFSKYFRPQHKLTQTTNNNRQNYKTNCQIFLIFVWFVFIYGPFGSSTVFSRSSKNIGNIEVPPRDWDQTLSQSLGVTLRYLTWNYSFWCTH